MTGGRAAPEVGFCAAGSGVGSLVGTALGPWLYPPLAEGQGTQHEQMLAP